MKAVVLAVLCAVLVACGGSGGRKPSIPDQAGVDACFLTIGVTKPGESGKLGTPEGWYKAAKKAHESANTRIRLAGDAVLIALDPKVAADGYSDPEIEAFRLAAVNFETACKETNAFSGSPFAQPT